MTEQEAQILVHDWVKAKLPGYPFIHIANERDCSWARGKALKRMGVRKGVSDIFMPRPNAMYSGLWLELKVGYNKPTPEQMQFIADMLDCGYYACWRKGADAAIATITAFYRNEELV